MPEISIIVPVYNVEQYLHQCLGSILAQTFTDFECILVNDCSSDNSPGICDEYAKIDGRIKVIHKPHNEGSSLARKTGFENSKGDYIIYVDSDDWIEINMIEKMYSLAVSDNYDMVYCDFYNHDMLNKVSYIKVPDLSNDFIMNIKLAILDNSPGGSLFNKLVRRKIYDKVVFPEYSIAEDKYITTQTLFFSKKIGYINAALYHYRYNMLSLMRQSSIKSEQRRDFEKRNNFKKIFDFLKSHSEDLSIFEPELSIRVKWIEKKNPVTLRRIIMEMLRFIVPVKIWGELKKMYYKSQSVEKI